MAPDLTLAAALAGAQQRFDSAGLEAPRLQARALLAHVLGIDAAALLARLREPLGPETAGRYERLVERRLAREPLQYLTGRAAFLDFELGVGPGVFIPRPETEGVVERALAEWSPASRLAIDLCTGSGAIAIALARSRPDARVLAIDVSPTALARTRANAAALGVGARVQPVRADLLGALHAPSDVGVLVCNPPYARTDEVVQPEVRDHEPVLAWSAGPLGTEVYARLAADAAELLPPGRPLVLELGYGQETAVRELLERDGRWESPRIDDDFQGIPRVLTTYRASAGPAIRT